MSQINGLGANSAVQKAPRQTVSREVPADPPAQLPATDKLDLSGVSHLLNHLKTNDIRADKVAAVRAQIDAGTYEDDHKINTAVDRLLDDLNE